MVNPMSMAICWVSMIDPRLSCLEISARYTGDLRAGDANHHTIDDVADKKHLPVLYGSLDDGTDKQKIHENQIAYRRPHWSDTYPDAKEPMTELAARADPIVPWQVSTGLSK